MESMRHEHQHLPVTALALWRETYLLSGAGTYLSVYALDSELLEQVRIFEAQAIHGILLLDVAPSATVLIWGGSLIRPATISVQDAAVRVDLGDTQRAGDWILDVAFAPSIDTLAGLVTAHNAFLTVHISQRPQTAGFEPIATLQAQLPGSNCILYSAHLTWLSASQCLIASGTSFGDVTLWSAILDPVGKNHARSQVHSSFSAHEGSVFGVRLSAQLSTPGLQCERALLSCSDDRTVRLWDVSGIEMSTTPSLQRETGFGSRVTDARQAPRCLAKSIGHVSRVWHVRYAPPEQRDELMRVHSFGEDASVIVWALRADTDSFILSQVHLTRAHAGKNIWAALSDHCRSGSLVSGGADGAIALYKYDQREQDAEKIPNPTTRDATRREGFRAYDFVDTHVLVSVTDHGRVLLLDLSKPQNAGAFDEISAPLPGPPDYSILSAVPSYAFIGRANGKIYAYSHAMRRISELADTEGKISGLFAQKHSSSLVTLLACTVNSTVATLLVLQTVDNDSPYLTRSLQLELTAGFVVTSFTSNVSNNHHYAVLGSRSGSIAVYRLSENTHGSVRCFTFCGDAHGKEAVTSLKWIRSVDPIACHETDLLFSTGRDGTFAAHELSFFPDRIEMELVHQLLMSFGPNIEGLHISAGSNTLVWGFRSKHFVVYDVNAQREIMTVECGGVHRNWTFRPAGNGGEFLWTKASELCRSTQSSLPYELMNAGGHGREIKAVASSVVDARRVVATGAEDTSIKLFTVQKSEIEYVQTLRKHNTGVQHLAWCGRNLFSSGGFEEFFVWRVSLGVPFLGAGVVCESVHPRSGTSDLRIMGFDVQGKTGKRDFIINMAYSDSNLKRWRYCDGIWEMLASGDYLTSCLTHVFRSNHDGRFVLTAATDGHIARWTTEVGTARLKWSDRHKIHQSAIHEVVSVDLPDGDSLIITGGDDNAVGVTRAGPDGKLWTILIPSAHAAAVTGLAIVPLNANTFAVASAGIDQRIKLWQVNVDAARLGTDGIEIQRLHETFTAVADVSGVAHFTHSDGKAILLVCGVGMDIFSLPCPI